SFRKIASSIAGYPNIAFTRPIKIAPNSLEAGRRINEVLFRSHVRKAALEMGMTNPLLWLNPHSAVHMAGRMGESGVIYDITDDWTLASFSPRDQKLISCQDLELCKRADLVVVCSEALEVSRKKIARRVALIPNGVDVDHYSKVTEKREERERRW